MKSKSLSPPFGFSLLPLTLLLLGDIAKIAFPTLDPMYIYIPLLLGFGMVSGIVLERCLREYARAKDATNHDCKAQAAIN